MDIMLDLETLGKAAGCVVLSIGATVFDGKHGVTEQHFHAHLGVDEQIKAGLKMDHSTVLWWLSQSAIARDALKRGRLNAVDPPTGLCMFADWYVAQKGETVWGNGADFDLPILGALYTAFGLPIPWAYSAGRDCRTIMWLAKRKMGDFGTVNDLAHDAWADAYYQAKEISKAIAHLSNFGA